MGPFDVAILTVRRVKRATRVAWTILAAAAIGQAEVVSEMNVRAAILLQLANYTQWPAAAFRAPQDPFHFCVMGDNRLSSALATTARDRKLYGRPVIVRQIEEARDLTTCHVIFVRHTRERQIRDIVQAIGSAPALTVGEAESFLACGGIMNLAWENGSVHFEISQDGARAAGLAISSRLLRLARLYGAGGEH